MSKIYTQVGIMQDAVNEKKNQRMYKIFFVIPVRNSDTGLYSSDTQKYYTVFIIIINSPILLWFIGY